MNEYSKKVKQSLTCSYCSKIYIDPIELPCEDYICREHLNQKEVVQKNTIRCSTCCQEFKVKHNDFKSVKSILKQIENKIYLNEKEISLKQKIEDSIKIFYAMYEDFISSKRKLDLDCHNHFQEIRFQLDQHREQLIEKIDDVYMEMIKKTKEFEATYLKNLDEKLSSSIKSFEIKTIDEELNKTEEEFRDPKLLTKTIEEMNLKQQEAVSTIQLKLNEINQVKDDLKSSHQFIPFLSFNKDLFGQLDLSEHSSYDPFNSKILRGQQPLALIKLCEFHINPQFKLLYRANETEFQSSQFHSICDDKSNTLTILKANGFIFGGFTSVTWDSSFLSSSGFKSDPNAFLFSLTNKDNTPYKMTIDRHQHKYAIYCHPAYGPTFGSGHDIHISTKLNTTNGSYSNLGYTYNHPKYATETNEAQTFLVDSHTFQLNEIEVYQVE